MTIKELYPQWYEDRKAVVKQSSMAAYEARYRYLIEPDDIADKDIETLKNSEVQKFCNAMFSKYSRSYAKAIMNLLKSIVEYYYILNDEPVRIYKVRFPSINKSVKRPCITYSVLQEAVLTNYCLNHMKSQSLGTLIALFAGLRIGEVCGLKWEDIDLAKGRLTVRRTIERFKNDGLSAVHEQTPKTYSSARTIPISEDLRCLLASQKKDGNIYVVSNREVPAEPSSMRRSYERLCKRAGVPVLKFHSMRHGFASKLIMNHIDPATVSGLLGHHSASTTLNIYTHSNQQAQFLAVNSGASSILSGL